MLGELGFEGLVIFNNTIMDEINAADVVGVGVGDGRLAVGGPASVADAEVVGGFVGGDFLLEGGDFALDFEKCGFLRVFGFFVLQTLTF